MRIHVYNSNICIIKLTGCGQGGRVFLLLLQLTFFCQVLFSAKVLYAGKYLRENKLCIGSAKKKPEKQEIVKNMSIMLFAFDYCLSV